MHSPSCSLVHFIVQLSDLKLELEPVGCEPFSIRDYVNSETPVRYFTVTGDHQIVDTAGVYQI